MSLVKRNGNFLPMLFDEMFNRDLFDWGNSNFSNTNTTIPAVNIKETAQNYEVEVAAPSMTKNDFRLELDGNTLTISSEKATQKEENENERYSRKEFSYQSFQRKFTLQKDVVDVDKIQAKYENGVLHLVIPKKEEAKQKPPRLIQIVSDENLQTLIEAEWSKYKLAIKHGKPFSEVKIIYLRIKELENQAIKITDEFKNG